jgi:hypothetical protein
MLLVKNWTCHHFLYWESELHLEDEDEEELPVVADSELVLFSPHHHLIMIFNDVHECTRILVNCQLIFNSHQPESNCTSLISSHLESKKSSTLTQRPML